MKRIYHTWDKWECYPAGFYESKAPNEWTALEATRQYAEFLRDTPRFAAALERVLSEWPNSCEHYLSNVNMNRIAWLGQASACIAMALPAAFRGGYHLLSLDEQRTADETALVALNSWLENHGEPSLPLDKAGSAMEVELY
jgi:hypothetical protein